MPAGFIRSGSLEEVRTPSRPSSKGAGSTGAGSRIHRSAGETAPPFRHPARTSFSPSAFRPKSGSDPRRKPKRAPIELPRVLRPECLTKRSAAVRVRSIRSSSRSLPRRELDARGETVQSAGSVPFSQQHIRFRFGLAQEAAGLPVIGLLEFRPDKLPSQLKRTYTLGADAHERRKHHVSRV